MTIIEDTRQQAEKHEKKHEYFRNKEVKIIRSKLPIGDYARLDNMSVVIDTKKDIQELIMDVTKDHKRFRNELVLAQDNGIKLIVLVENNDKVSQLSDLENWTNPRLIEWSKNCDKVIKEKKKQNPEISEDVLWKTAVFKKPPTNGTTLAKILKTMQEKYGVDFRFCTSDECPEIIENILENL